MSEEIDSVLEPVTVVYCQKCGMPPEYCEYGPDFETHCDPWLRKNHPGLHAKLKEVRGDTNTTETSQEVQEEEKDTRPTDPWTTEERLTAFYEKYQPDKVSDVPNLLEKYSGKEDKLFVALTKKYGPEPDDPYYDDEESDEEDEGEIEEGMENLNVSGDGKKRRGVKAKKVQKMETQVFIQKEKSKGKKKHTVIIGMETVPGIKLKDVAKAFSKRFAGSASVKEKKGKDGDKASKEIIIQGDHMEDVASMIVKDFKVPGESVFLDFEGEYVAFK